MRFDDLRGQSAETLAEIFQVDAVHRPHLARFTARPFPDKRSEAYRYADLEPVWRAERTRLNLPLVGPRPGKALVITDGIVTEIPSGVDVRYGDTIKYDPEHPDPLYHLGHAISSRRIIITCTGAAALRIEHHLHTPEALIAYRVAVVMSSSVPATVTERFVDTGARGSLLLYGYDLSVSPGATLTLIKDQTIDAAGCTTLASHALDVADDATLHFGSFDLGGGRGMQHVQIVLGNRARVQASHLVYAEGTARRGTVSLIHHRGAHAHSTQRAKNILSGTARGIFDANIRVAPTGRYAKAHQNSKAILLNPGAYMVSKPQLEIDIDELEASHGSTTGQLDAGQIFYLQSRGIAESEARKMLILAFANELIDAIEDPKIREQIHVSFENAYYGHTQLECLETCHGCV